MHNGEEGVRRKERVSFNNSTMVQCLLLCLLLLCWLSPLHATNNVKTPYFTLDVLDRNHWLIKGVVENLNSTTQMIPASSKAPSIFVERAATPTPYHPNHTCYDITLRNNRTYFCFPLVTVGGVSKCGTSTVYRMFAASRKMVFGPRGKEKCNNMFFEYLVRT